MSMTQIITTNGLSEIIELTGTAQPDRSSMHVTSNRAALPNTSYAWYKILIALDANIKDSQLANEVLMCLIQYFVLDEEVVRSFDLDHFDVHAIGCFSGVIRTSSVTELLACSNNTLKPGNSAEADQIGTNCLHTTFVKYLQICDQNGWSQANICLMHLLISE